MAFTKTFGTADGSYATATNWLPINVRSSAYSWTASGSGTGEYYLRTAAGANPGFAAQPTAVHINDVAATEGTMGSLTAGQFDYGDNDTLGYSTLYIRLTADADPDSQAHGHIKFYQIPQAGEHVRFVPGAGDVTGGLDQSAVAISSFTVERGNRSVFGVAPTATAEAQYLQIDPDTFEFFGGGLTYINLGSAAIDASIRGTAAAAGTGEFGMYLKGSALDVVSVMGGSVGLAVLPGESATVATLYVGDAGGITVTVGSGVALTDLVQAGGTVELRCGTTTSKMYSGTLRTEGAGVHAAATLYGGTYISNSSGNVTVLNLRGGTFDETQSGIDRTVATVNRYRGNSILKRNVEAVTHTAEVTHDSMTITAG